MRSCSASSCATSSSVPIGAASGPSSSAHPDTGEQFEASSAASNDPTATEPSLPGASRDCSSGDPAERSAGVLGCSGVSPARAIPTEDSSLGATASIAAAAAEEASPRLCSPASAIASGAADATLPSPVTSISSSPASSSLEPDLATAACAAATSSHVPGDADTCGEPLLGCCWAVCFASLPRLAARDLVAGPRFGSAAGTGSATTVPSPSSQS